MRNTLLCQSLDVAPFYQAAEHLSDREEGGQSFWRISAILVQGKQFASGCVPLPAYIPASYQEPSLFLIREKNNLGMRVMGSEDARCQVGLVQVGDLPLPFRRTGAQLQEVLSIDQDHLVSALRRE